MLLTRLRQTIGKTFVPTMRFSVIAHPETQPKQSNLLNSYNKLIADGKIQPDKHQLKLVNLLNSVNESLRRQQHHRGVYIYGRVGSGKTAMMDLFHKHIAENVPSSRVHFHQFLIDVHQRMHKHRKSRGPLLEGVARDIVQEMRLHSKQHGKYSVLCFDEMALSDITDAVILKTLFTSLFAHNVIIVATSNRLPSQLYEAGLNRPMIVPFLKRLEHECIIFSMSENNKDYRMEKANSSIKCFFAPLEHERFSTPTTPTELAVPGFGRNVTVETSEFGVHATFQTLSSSKWGPADVATITNHLKQTGGSFHLTNVRPFASSSSLSPEEESQFASLDDAKRFITLIDLLYEARIPLIIESSAPTPADLFTKLSLPQPALQAEFEQAVGTIVKGEGGSSSSHATTFYSEKGNVIEWSATGLKDASLAGMGDDTPGARDARFAVQRSLSRLAEMSSVEYNKASM
jgi:protein AFG1